MEITKKRLKQLIREEVKYLAKEDATFRDDSFVAAIEKAPEIGRETAKADTAEEIQDYLEKAVMALDTTGHQVDFLQSAASLKNLEMALRNVLTKVQKKELQVGDKETEEQPS